jgi:hypothetical protein
MVHQAIYYRYFWWFLKDQFSVLCCLYIYTYINVLPIFFFADDTTLLASNSNLAQPFSYVNKEFRKVIYYFRAHKLALHPEKTVFILISNSAPADHCEIIYIDNNNYDDTYDPALKLPILSVNQLQMPKTKFLGVLLNLQLNFRFHVKSVSAKIYNSLYHRRAARNILSQQSLTTLYYSLIYSHLIYAIHVWSCTSPIIVNKLYIKQKIAICIIHNSK